MCVSKIIPDFIDYVGPSFRLFFLPTRPPLYERHNMCCMQECNGIENSLHMYVFSSIKSLTITAVVFAFTKHLYLHIPEGGDFDSTLTSLLLKEKCEIKKQELTVEQCPEHSGPPN